MVWISKEKRNLLEITHLREGIPYTHSKEYTPGKYSSDIKLFLLKEDTELRVKPYTLEHLTNEINEDYPEHIINKLIAGIRNGESVEYLGYFWTSKKFKNEKRIQQWFFKDDKPSGINFGMISGPDWPINQGAILDEKLRIYFAELIDKQIAHVSMRSLWNCIDLLSQPVPEYNPVEDRKGTGIKVNF